MLENSDAVARPGFRVSLASLERAQKPGAGVPAYMRWVNRGAARGIAAAAAAAGLTPNAVTAISAGLTAAGLAVLVAAPPGLVVGALVAALLALGFACDSADGQLARLTGAGGPAGEWLDHVVDAIRTPTVHLCVAAAALLHGTEPPWTVPVAVCFAVLGTGQFTSQILAEQLVRGSAARASSAGSDPEPVTSVDDPGGLRKSFLLLPTDTGVLCWSFLLWGDPTAFAACYALLFALNLVHAAASMRRKYLKLAARPRPPEPRRP